MALFGITLFFAMPVPDVLAERPTANESGSPAFSVMSWNLEWFFDDAKKDNYSPLAIEKASPSRGEWNWRRDAAAGVIAQVRPTVVAAQEIEGQRVLWYLGRALDREHKMTYDEFVIQGNDYFTEQDVGLLVQAPAEVVSVMQGHVTQSMKRTARFGSVPKHVAAMIDVRVGDRVETILVVNVHLRSGEAGRLIREKQAATLNEWIDRWLFNHESTHLIVLGDFNTEEVAGQVAPTSEVAILQSRSTPTPEDDLIDLLEEVPSADRQTHLLAGKQFDRILVSRSLVEDDPETLDLCLSRVTVRRDLVIQGKVDTQTQHWDEFWQSPQADRDLSDHYPVIAEFEVR